MLAFVLMVLHLPMGYADKRFSRPSCLRCEHLPNQACAQQWCHILWNITQDTVQSCSCISHHARQWSACFVESGVHFTPCVMFDAMQALTTSNSQREPWESDPLVAGSAPQLENIRTREDDLQRSPKVMSLPKLLGVLPAHVSTAVVVHTNVAVYAMAYWMNLSLLPFLTKGNAVVLTKTRRNPPANLCCPCLQSLAWMS